MATKLDAGLAAITPKATPANLIRTSKEEEGSSKGEIWAVLRALAGVIGVIAVIGYLIG